MSITKAAVATEAAGLFLSVNNIEVVYDRVFLAVKGVSIEVPEAGLVALLGANGAGKSTILKAISGLLTPERGEVTRDWLAVVAPQFVAMSAPQYGTGTDWGAPPPNAALAATTPPGAHAASTARSHPPHPSPRGKSA